MLIKKNKNKNQYAVTEGGVYVRDFTQYGITAVDVNQFLSTEDCDLCLTNELHNVSSNIASVDNESFQHLQVVIVSDGYNFEQKQSILAKLPKNICIIAINGALKKWKLVGETASEKRAINYYVVNNPYGECLSYFPTHRYFPRCIASSRTNPDFLLRYPGLKYLYYPTENNYYSGLGVRRHYYIDDYRNSVCAALSLAYRFGAQKILLFCCDDSFADERAGAVKNNDLWCYPQQLFSKDIIDANCFWLKKSKIEVADSSNCGNYKNATYINCETEDILRYFTNEQ